MLDRKRTCVIFITQYMDEYRVIYKSGKEWLIDAPESTIFAARNRAEQCIQALYLRPGCKKDAVKIYEISIARHLYQEMMHSLHNTQAMWQSDINTAAKILDMKENVSMVSLVSDSDNNGTHEPYLLVISNNMQTGQHFIDTIQLRKKPPHKDMGIVYKIREGKPCLFNGLYRHDNTAPSLTVDVNDQR